MGKNVRKGSEIRHCETKKKGKRGSHYIRKRSRKNLDPRTTDFGLFIQAQLRITEGKGEKRGKR